MAVVASLAEPTPAAAGRAARGKGGRYTAERNPLVLFEIVRDVAFVAARRDADRFKQPAAVSQAAWNSARHLLARQYGHIPQANEVCRQLCDRDGKPWRWPELLALVFDESRNPKKTWEERLSEPDRAATEQHVHFALNYIDQRLGEETRLQFFHQYEELRGELLRDASAGGNPVEALRQRLPTRAQITGVCGGWERALEVAGLQPSSAPGESMPIIDALLRFYEEAGYLPTEVELVDATRQQGISLERDSDGPWLEVVSDAEKEPVARGLPEPPPYGTRPAAEGSGRRHGTAKGAYTHVQLLESVQKFSASLPVATAATNKRWREFQRGQPGVPSLTVVLRHGGLKGLLRQASRPDWRERAEEWDAQAQAAPGRQQGRPRSDKSELLYTLIKGHGDVSARELAEQLGCSLDMIRRGLRPLKDAGRIEATHPHVRARNQRYRPASTGEANP